MFTEHIKTIEDNAISMLHMIPRREESMENVSDFLKEVFESQNTALSDPLLKRLTRFVMNEIRSAGITRQNADAVILTVVSNIGMKELVQEYKETVK